MKWLIAVGLVAGITGCGSDSVVSGGPYVDGNESAVYPAPDEDPSLVEPKLCVDDDLAMDQIIVNEVDIEEACGKKDGQEQQG